MKIRLLAFIISFSFGQVQAAPIDAIKTLSEQFTQNYKQAVAHEHERVVKLPRITQDLLSMTLYMSTGETQRYIMDKEIYKTVAEFAHIPLTVHHIIEQYDWVWSEDLAQAIKRYREILKQVEVEIIHSDIAQSLKDNVLKILGETNLYLGEMLAQSNPDKKAYYALNQRLNLLIKENLDLGASTQIKQFHTQVQAWKQQYPNEAWGDLLIAVMGSHGARDGYVLSQYFQWLREEPGYEKSVIYVEFPEVSDIYKDKDRSQTLALMALDNHRYQLNLAVNSTGDERFMQRDVMDESAKVYLSTMEK